MRSAKFPCGTLVLGSWRAGAWRRDKRLPRARFVKNVSGVVHAASAGVVRGSGVAAAAAGGTPGRIARRATRGLKAGRVAGARQTGTRPGAGAAVMPPVHSVV